jgi:hypothetical protein
MSIMNCWKKRALALAAVTASVIGVSVPAAVAAEPRAAGPVFIGNLSDRGVLETRGSDVWTGGFYEGDNQKWQLVDQPGGTVAIMSTQTGQCVTASVISPLFSHVRMEDCASGNPSQSWSVRDRFANVASFAVSAFGTDFCLGASPYGEQRVMVTRCNESSEQAWEVFQE